MKFDKTVKRYLKESKQSGPPYIKQSDTGTRYFKYPNHTILHREDGPACEWADGGKGWYINGIRHRVDGPAVVSFNGRKEWWDNGLLHRENGPAIIFPNGKERWFIHGEKLTSKQIKELKEKIEMKKKIFTPDNPLSSLQDLF